MKNNNLKNSREILEAVRPQGTLYRLASLTAFLFGLWPGRGVMKSIGLEWWILYSEIFFLTCIMGYWLGNCFDRILRMLDELKERR